MRIIIAGAGAVGRHLAKLLSHEDMDISLIDERQDRLGDLDANYDLLTKIGSPTSIHDLKNINVKDVDLFHFHNNQLFVGELLNETRLMSNTNVE